MKKEKIGIAASAAGVTSTSVGVIGAGCVACAPICAGAKLAGLSWVVTSIFGAGAATFLSKYHMLFTILGLLTSFTGVFLYFRARNKAMKLKKECRES